MLICRINENKKKQEILQAQLCESECWELWLCHTVLCGYALWVTDEQMSGWWPSITPLVSSCRPWWPCDIGVCRAKEGDFGLLVSLPSSMIIETRSIWPWDHYNQVYGSSQRWWFWLWTLNGSTKLLHSRHTQSDTHLHLSAYLQHSGIRTHWDGRCTWLHFGRECWRTHQCQSDTWCQ